MAEAGWIPKLKVGELRMELGALGLDTKGLKKVLVARLTAGLASRGITQRTSVTFRCG